MSTDATSASDPGNLGGGTGSSGMGFKIATLVLAITTVGFAIWGFVTYQNLDKEKAALASATSVIAGDTTEIRQAKQAIANLAKGYNVETGEFNAGQIELEKVRTEYNEAQKAAASANASAQAKLAAAQAQAKLAQTCARTLASGLVTIYSDIGTVATYAEVAAAMAKASVPCQGIATVNPTPLQ